MDDDITFQLDIEAASSILTELSKDTIQRSGQAIAARANSIIAKSTNRADISVDVKVGTIKRGRRAIATIGAESENAHTLYIARQAIIKSKDAGRV